MFIENEPKFAEGEKVVLNGEYLVTVKSVTGTLGNVNYYDRPSDRMMYWSYTVQYGDHGMVIEIDGSVLEALKESDHVRPETEI